MLLIKPISQHIDDAKITRNKEKAKYFSQKMYNSGIKCPKNRLSHKNIPNFRYAITLLWVFEKNRFCRTFATEIKDLVSNRKFNQGDNTFINI